jgi:signal transduction histidine kinase
MLPALN